MTIGPMEDDPDFDIDIDADDRALAVHEAGHTAVAHALGADIIFIEIDLATGDGGSRSSKFDEDQGLCRGL
jgi:hypothetical protein